MIPPSRPLCAGMAKATLQILLALFVAVPVFARTEGEGAGSVVCRDLRTGWSIYGGGGLSRASGVQYPNVNARRSLDFSPAVVGGVDFTLRPWVRFGAEYLWSRWRREQRPSVPDPSVMPFKAYGSHLTDGHGVSLHADINFMCFRKAGRMHGFNIWAGTGVGFMSGVGNEYSLLFSTTQTHDGTTVPVGGDVSMGNEGSVTITGNVQSLNEDFRFNRIVIPVTLHFEVDLSLRWTAGVKGEAAFLTGRDANAPERLFSVLFTLRHHFVRSRAKVSSRSR